jgi:putative transcriptional regulator
MMPRRSDSMKRDDFDRLVQSIRQAGKIQRGEMAPSRMFVLEDDEIKSIRTKLHKSQSEFASLIGVSVSTVQNWEQGRRKPDGPARILLRIASRNPELLEELIYAASPASR